jgi:N-acetylglucosaminylphosphatidylinositol deacetylase
MTKTWSESAISTLLTSIFAPHRLPSPSSPGSASGRKSRSDHNATRPPASVDAIITFDRGGVSSHPNHISLYHGARAFVSSLVDVDNDDDDDDDNDSRNGGASPVDLYTLTSVSVLRKYVSFLDAFATVFSALSAGSGTGAAGKGNQDGDQRGRGRERATRKAAAESEAERPAVLVSMSALSGGRESYGTARRAMTDAHQSQMVWFRWGYIAFSRYMLINDLWLERFDS